MLQVDELMGLLEDKGPAFLECYPVKGLSWEQVKELNGPNLVGLGMGSGPAPGMQVDANLLIQFHTTNLRSWWNIHTYNFLYNLCVHLSRRVFT